ncbi:hypothetical protein D3C75_1108660 [compost metagenome]
MAAAYVHRLHLRPFEPAVFGQLIDCKYRAAVLLRYRKRVPEMVRMSMGKQNRIYRNIFRRNS